jgi:acetylornithine deacetylase
MVDQIKNLQKSAIELLMDLIEIESFSKQEHETAKRIGLWFEEVLGQKPNQEANNIWLTNKYFDEQKPTLLLNSHHDTVKPNKAYTRDPFKAEIIEDKLFGLGSNDAGGPLVSLLACFAYFYDRKDLNFNLVMLASAEEEINGKMGIAHMMPIMPNVDVAIIGEPTQMQLAIAEKGLIVFDCKASGTPGHAAHIKEDMAIYKAMQDIAWLNSYEFPKQSELLGPVKLTVTQIEAGRQHNVVPAECDFVIDARINDCYSNQEVADFLQDNLKSQVFPRSLRLNSSHIPKDHVLVKSGLELGRETYGSPTLSDQALITCPSLKMGPGDSTRSHSADEFIYVSEIKDGIEIFIKLLENANRYETLG